LPFAASYQPAALPYRGRSPFTKVKFRDYWQARDRHELFQR
jgi:hypothetical protein